MRCCHAFSAWRGETRRPASRTQNPLRRNNSMNQPAQQQNPPGTEQQMRPTPDHGEASYQGSGRLAGKAAVVTGGDSGIGKAVAIAFAREGADVIISYLNQHEDAEDTRKWVEDAGRTAVLVPGDLTEA